MRVFSAEAQVTHAVPPNNLMELADDTVTSCGTFAQLIHPNRGRSDVLGIRDQKIEQLVSPRLGHPQPQYFRESRDCADKRT